MEKLEKLLKDSPETDSALKAKVASLDGLVAELLAGGVPNTGERACTAVLGGLGGLTEEEAKSWLADKLTVLEVSLQRLLTAKARITFQGYFFRGFWKP